LKLKKDSEKLEKVESKDSEKIEEKKEE